MQRQERDAETKSEKKQQSGGVGAEPTQQAPFVGDKVLLND